MRPNGPWQGDKNPLPASPYSPLAGGELKSVAEQFHWPALDADIELEPLENPTQEAEKFLKG